MMKIITDLSQRKAYTLINGVLCSAPLSNSVCDIDPTDWMEVDGSSFHDDTIKTLLSM